MRKWWRDTSFQAFWRDVMVEVTSLLIFTLFITTVLGIGIMVFWR